MSAEAVAAPTSPLIAELFGAAQPRRAFGLLGWGVALGAHLLAAGLALSEQRTAPRTLEPLLVELLPHEPEAPPPAPLSLPKAPAERVVERAPLPKAAAAPPPEPAHVGALLTAKADPSPSLKADEPVDFTNDPNALGFGSGVVAIGGRAEIGASHARPSAEAAAAARSVAGGAGEALTPASDLSRKPALAESDPCRGYFPTGAADDVASSAVLVTIAKTGAVSAVQLLSESPAQQGFGAAARTCMTGKRFSPGLDRDGNPTATRIRVNIRFAR
jgi:hypothetical protein